MKREGDRERERERENDGNYIVYVIYTYIYLYIDGHIREMCAWVRSLQSMFPKGLYQASKPVNLMNRFTIQRSPHPQSGFRLIQRSLCGMFSKGYVVVSKPTNITNLWTIKYPMYRSPPDPPSSRFRVCFRRVF